MFREATNGSLERHPTYDGRYTVVSHLADTADLSVSVERLSPPPSSARGQRLKASRGRVAQSPGSREIPGMRRVLFFFKLSSPWDFFSCPLLTVVEFHNLYVISFPEDIRTSTYVRSKYDGSAQECVYAV